MNKQEQNKKKVLPSAHTLCGSGQNPKKRVFSHAHGKLIFCWRAIKAVIALWDAFLLARITAATIALLERQEGKKDE